MRHEVAGSSRPGHAKKDRVPQALPVPCRWGLGRASRLDGHLGTVLFGSHECRPPTLPTSTRLLQHLKAVNAVVLVPPGGGAPLVRVPGVYLLPFDPSPPFYAIATRQMPAGFVQQVPKEWGPPSSPNWHHQN